MKYILMMNTMKAGSEAFDSWSHDEIKAHIAFMIGLNRDLTASGVLVAGEGLAFADEAKMVRAGKKGEPITDGVFPESKEFLAGFWIVDVETPEAAYAIAARASAAPGAGGKPLNMPIEVRQVMSGPPEEFHLTKNSDAQTEHLLRDLAPKVLGSVARHFGDFYAAEDAVQEAMVAAASQWPGDGVPDNPQAWLIRVASRRMIDHRRSESSRRQRESRAFNFGYFSPAGESDARDEQDDTLALLFMCAHQALSTSSAIALTLRAVGGLTTVQIANAFLVPETTMAQRISRAKQSIKASGAPFRLPSGEEWNARLRSVLHVLYLIFNEGYVTSNGPQLQMLQLSREAIRMTRMLAGVLPENGDVRGLLALMLLNDARRRARTGRDGELIPLTKQDRSLWDRSEISEGVALVSAALSSGSIGTYQIQAAIAAVHDEAESPEKTDWKQILALYEVLKRISDNPMVDLNHAIAAAMVHGAAAGLDLLERLQTQPQVARHHRLHAARAHLLEMVGDRAAAARGFRVASERTTNAAERNYLLMRAAELTRDLPKG